MSLPGRRGAGEEGVTIRKIIAGLLALLLIPMSACEGVPSSAVSAPASASVPVEPNAGITQTQGPAPEVNLITGEALAEGQTAGRRPVAVMVNNARAALPQRGVGSADAIFEMVTEGGITRLMALYADAAAIPQVGPVRSARDQHLQFAMPLNAIFVHIGSSVYAANLLNLYTYQDVDGRYLGTTAFWFDSERSKTRLNEHCWYTDAALIAAGIEKEQIAQDGAGTTLFEFVQPGAQPVVPNEGDAPDVAFQFSGDGAVRLTYDAATGTYLKQAYGEPHIDELTGAQLSFDNVLILFATVTLKPDGQCADFALTEGTGYYCYGGKYREIVWKKGDPEDPLRIVDDAGKTVLINPGKSYIGVVSREQQSTLTFNAAVPQADAAHSGVSAGSSSQPAAAQSTPASASQAS